MNSIRIGDFRGNKYRFSAPNHNDGGQYSYSDSDYVTEGPDDRKVNSRRSQHSSPMPMYQQSYQRECESISIEKLEFPKISVGEKGVQCFTLRVSAKLKIE